MNHRLFNYYVILVLAAVCLVSSCAREMAIDEQTESGVTIRFGAMQDDSKASFKNIKTDVEPLGIAIENAQEVALATNFNLSVTEQSLNDELFCEGIDVTKGTPVYTENLGTFKASACLPHSGGLYDGDYLQEAEYVKENGVWSHTYTEGINWPADHGKLVFFMRYPADDSFAGWNRTSMQLNGEGKYRNGFSSPSTGYATPGSGTDVTNAAELQKDLVFAVTSLSDEDAEKTNSVLFYHPFCGVKFKIGTAPADLVVKSVTLGNVIGNGFCTVLPYYGNEADYVSGDSNRDGAAETKSAACVSWNLTGGTRTSFTQTFAAADHKTTPDSGLFPEGYTGRTNNQNQLNTTTLSKTFNLIPQSFTAANKLSITLKLEYKGVELIRPATITATWEAGMLYTYTISFNSQIDVDITDACSETEKTDVVITNTGNVPEYLRAAIVGNWFDESGNIVSAWTGNGTFLNRGANWVQNGAYWYYKLPVAPGTATPDALFEKYTAPTPAPVSGAHLEMRIMVQAVLADPTVANQAWGVPTSLYN